MGRGGIVTKKIAVYVRVSTAEQAEHGISIPMQKSRSLAYIEARGDWKFFDCYADEGLSGKDLNRPEINRLISDAQKKLFDTVLVVKLDRLSRKQRDIMYLLEDVFKPNEIEFTSISENFDTTTPLGRAMLGIMAVFAQLEREVIVERVVDAKRETAKLGKFLGGPIPIGYKYDYENKVLKIDEPRAEIVRWIFREYFKGTAGLSSIARILNSNAVPPPGQANIWYESTIKQILKNHFFAGYINHKNNLFKGCHPAIITLDEFNAVQNSRKAQNNTSKDLKGLQGILKGLLICGECGAKMRQKTVLQNPRNKENSKKVLYYVCYSKDKSALSLIKNPNCNSVYHRAENIDEKVISKFLSKMHNKNYFEESARHILKVNSSEAIKNDFDNFVKELEAIKRKISRWDAAYEEGIIDSSEYVLKTKNLKLREAALNKEIASVKSFEKKELSVQADLKRLLNQMSNLNELWEEASFKEKQELIRCAVRNIKIFNEQKIEVNFI
ncbi:recombinase family protein [Selenomonadales bacterium OttesenSCG-928-I06]|nr:recombinase family protein [Selenomonadales bacterium OttesenSCG-928-I06]